MVVWADEATSGDALRPDSSRKIMSVYWSVLQLPDHIRSQDWGCLPFAVISYNCLKTVAAELSGLLRRALRTFFLDGVSNFASGFSVRLGRSGDRPWHKPHSFFCAVASPCPAHPGQLEQTPECFRYTSVPNYFSRSRSIGAWKLAFACLSHLWFVPAYEDGDWQVGCVAPG